MNTNVHEQRIEAFLDQVDVEQQIADRLTTLRLHSDDFVGSGPYSAAASVTAPVMVYTDSNQVIAGSTAHSPHVCYGVRDDVRLPWSYGAPYNLMVLSHSAAYYSSAFLPSSTLLGVHAMSPATVSPHHSPQLQLPLQPLPPRDIFSSMGVFASPSSPCNTPNYQSRGRAITAHGWETPTPSSATSNSGSTFGSDMFGDAGYQNMPLMMGRPILGMKQQNAHHRIANVNEVRRQLFGGKRTPHKGRQKGCYGAEDGKIECAFCKNNGEPIEVYGTHKVKDEWGRTTCPKIRPLFCYHCGGTGDNAHTLRRCPQKPPILHF